MHELLAENSNDLFFNDVNGCRKGGTVTLCKEKSGGIIIIITCSGYALAIKKNLYRETPTQIICDLFAVLTSSPASRAYYERIEALGWDMCCNVWLRLLKLFSKKLLTKEQVHFFSIDIISRFFSDSFHISSHRCPLCAFGPKCIFQPGLPRFTGILKDERNKSKANANIAEHTWVNWNKLKFTTKLSAERYDCLLQGFLRWINDRNDARLTKKKYHFEDIARFSRLRVYDEKKTDSDILSSSHRKDDIVEMIHGMKQLERVQPWRRRSARISRKKRRLTEEENEEHLQPPQKKTKRM